MSSPRPPRLSGRPSGARVRPGPQELADLIAKKVHDGDWTRENFPDRRAIARAFDASRDNVPAALEILQERNILVRQPDPASGGRIRRELPPAPDGSVYESVPAAQRVADQIVQRIHDGTWAADRFPAVVEVAEVLGCALHTACAAMRLLEHAKVVHKIELQRVPGRRGVDRVWRPVSVPTESAATVGLVIEAAIRSGELTGELPTVPEMTVRYGIGVSAMAQIYRDLTDQGLIAQAWTADLSRQAWFVMDKRTRKLRRGTKAMVVAADLRDRMTEWLMRLPQDQWRRRRLPAKNDLQSHYSTHVYTIDDALEILAACGVLERVPTAVKQYLPAPPANVDHCGVDFPLARRQQEGRWLRTGSTQVWLPLPESEDDLRRLVGEGLRR